MKILVEQKVVLLYQLCRLSSLLVSQGPEDGCKPSMNNCTHSPNSIINQANPKKLHQMKRIWCHGLAFKESNKTVPFEPQMIPTQEMQEGHLWFYPDHWLTSDH